jgi:hypothetical protein
MIKVVKFVKDALLFIPITLVVQPLSKLLLLILYFNKLIIWKNANKGTILFNDFYKPIRNYNKRIQLYEFLINHFNLREEQFNYLEFGVASGLSFQWWMANNSHVDSKFFGFDTFEGLPENWGVFYKKGDMSSGLPIINDQRGEFIKGLFQQSLIPFIDTHRSWLKDTKRKIIHLDADLYTATSFVLSQLYFSLNKNDIILFDEFSVPLHEFKAFHEFMHVYNIKLQPIAAVNNYYQIAFIVL